MLLMLSSCTYAHTMIATRGEYALKCMQSAQNIASVSRTVRTHTNTHKAGRDANMLS
jgi:hypothetical protein